jgi:acyl carrier protein
LIREKVIKAIMQLLHEDQVAFNELTDDSVLLDTGLDSLGFAVLIARLEDELGFDPFTSLKFAIYPKTIAEFVKIYEDYKVQD